MDDPANSTTTPPEPFWHAENVAEPVTTPTPTPPPPPPPVPEPTVIVPEIPVMPPLPEPIVTIPEPPVIPTPPAVDPLSVPTLPTEPASPPPLPPEPMMRTVPPTEPVVAIKSKKGSGAKVVLGVLIFLLISAAGVLGYMAIQGKGLPFNLGKKAAEPCTCENQGKCDVAGGCNPACCGGGGDCPSGETCSVDNGYCVSGKSCGGGGQHKDCVSQLCVNVPGGSPTDDKCSSNDQCKSTPQATATPITTSAPTEKCCPGGTKDCSSGQQCMRGGTCGNICKTQPGPLPGCCTSPDQCASWETCSIDNGACGAGGKSCGSHAGCATDSDCASGAKCIGGTCQGGSGGNVVCEATSNGVKITNTTGDIISGTLEWFSKKCSDNGGSNCACTGAPTTEGFTVNGSGGTWSKSISGSGCAWQSDIKVISGSPPIVMGCNNAGSGCISGCATPTSPPAAPSCSGLTLSQSNITLGQSVTVSANISNYGLIRYGVCTSGTDCRVVDSQNPTTLGSGNNPVSKSFTPTAVGKYVFEVNAYDSSTCNSFCSAGSIWYKNTLAGGGGCDTANHWTSSGSCTSTGCIKWLTVIEAPASPVCLDVTVVKKGTTSLAGLVPGDTIVITVTASDTVSDMAIRIKKDGVKLTEAFTAEGTWIEQGKKWQYEYVIPANGAGSYEVQGFIKTGGVWK